MDDGILTLNAGSSSIKFALFAQRDPVPHIPHIPHVPELAGQIDGLGARPHLKAREASGRVDDVDLPLEKNAAHRAALSFLVDWLHRRASGRRIAAVGHRVVHGLSLIHI